MGTGLSTVGHRAVAEQKGKSGMTSFAELMEPFTGKRIMGAGEDEELCAVYLVFPGGWQLWIEVVDGDLSFRIEEAH
jgi:hypothetical protein